MTLLESNSFIYFAGYLQKRLHACHDCSTCHNVVTVTRPQKIHQQNSASLFLSFNAYTVQRSGVAKGDINWCMPPRRRGKFFLRPIDLDLLLMKFWYHDYSLTPKCCMTLSCMKLSEKFCLHLNRLMIVLSMYSR